MKKLAGFVMEVYAPGLHLAFAAAWFLSLLGSLVLLEASGQPFWLDLHAASGALTLFLCLFCLRVLDELKDIDYDRVMNPDRPLVRGSVTPGDLRRYFVMGALPALALSVWHSWYLAGIVLADLAYGVLLIALEVRSARVRDGMFLNLAVTYPVNVALSVYTYEFFLEHYESRPTARGALVVIAFALAFLHYEISRKTVWPHLAREGERLYSREIGGTGSALLAFACAATACALLAFLFRPWQAEGPLALASWFPLLPIAPACASLLRFLRRREQRVKLAPLAMLFLLLFYVGLLLQALAGIRLAFGLR